MNSKIVKIGLVFFLISIFQIPILEKSYSEDESNSCTLGWNITGYFLPIESDYSGKLIEISVGENKQSYVADFVDVIRIEGWGRTNAGNYLGWYGDSYHISDTSLDSQGGVLVVGTVAVDASFIEPGSKLTIPTLPEPWNSVVFSALDEGPSIIGKDIDVYTGEGIEGENETFRITGSNNDVCIVQEELVFEPEVKSEVVQASGICGEGTVLVNGVCQVTKTSGTITESLYILIGAIAIGGGIVGGIVWGIIVAIFAVKKGTKTAKPEKQIKRKSRKKVIRRKPRKKLA